MLSRHLNRPLTSNVLSCQHLITLGYAPAKDPCPTTNTMLCRTTLRGEKRPTFPPLPYMLYNVIAPGPPQILVASPLHAILQFALVVAPELCTSLSAPQKH